jgi:hypothetical protein
MMICLGKAFFGWSQSADVLCTEVHKRKDNEVRGGDRFDARRNYTMSKVIVMFVCGCYESELCLCVVRGVFIPPILLKILLKWNETGVNIPELVQ